MLPILAQLGPVKIYTMGVFLLMAFLLGSFLLWKLFKLTPYKEEEIFDSLFFVIFGSIFFSRLIYVAANISEFKFDILKFILINGYPGMSLVGALIGGFISFSIYFRIKNKKILEVIDYIIPSIFIVLSIGKIGSFLSGLDVGTKTRFILNAHYLGYAGPRHIIALYEALLYLLGFIVSYKMLYRIRRQELFQGTNLFYFLLLFSAVNLIVDKFKENHIYFAELSLNHITSYIFGSIALIYFLYNYRQQIISRFIDFRNKINRKK